MSRINKSMENYTRIQSADEIDNIAALKLIEELLKRTHSEYVKALKIEKKLKNKKDLNSKDKTKLENAQETIKECEEFYLSDRFQIFTLGKSLPGQEVIEKIRKQVNAQS